MIDAIILDIEATGLEEPEVIELAWKGWLRDDEMHRTLYKPTKPLSWGAIAMHHILMEELEGSPPTSQAALDVPPSKFIIGHGIDFDWRALGQPDSRRICTLAMARELWPEVDSHTLTAMTYYIRGATKETRAQVRNAAHGAVTDVLLCEYLLQTVMDVAKISDLESLWSFSEAARIPKVMTFGKFKGQPVSAVDRGYMNWYRKQPDTDPYLLEAFERNGM